MEISIIAAKAVQLLQEPETPEEQQAKAEAIAIQGEEERKNKATDADIARKDKEAMARIDREEAVTVSSLGNKLVQEEERLTGG